jgi:hypothetical protein
MESITGGKAGTDVHARSQMLERLAAQARAILPTLEESEVRTAMGLFRMLAEGKPVSRERLAERLTLPVDEVSAALTAMPAVFHDKEGRIVAFWGLGLGKTATGSTSTDEPCTRGASPTPCTSRGSWARTSTSGRRRLPERSSRSSFARTASRASRRRGPLSRSSSSKGSSSTTTSSATSAITSTSSPPRRRGTAGRRNNRRTS